MQEVEWLNNPNACVYFSNAENIISLLLTGYVKIFTDDETKRNHWKPGDEEYYALGVTDPDYCMICFTAKSGNFMSQNKYIFDVGDGMDTVTYTYDNGWRKK